MDKRESAFSTLKWNTCHNTTYKINVCLCLCLRFLQRQQHIEKSFFRRHFDISSITMTEHRIQDIISSTIHLD